MTYLQRYLKDAVDMYVRGLLLKKSKYAYPFVPRSTTTDNEKCTREKKKIEIQDTGLSSQRRRRRN